jgi:uncharacterized membrane protein YphA (DoxX/SURF4 family)
MKKTISNVGRILFGIIFLVFGFFHFSGAEMMAAWLPEWMPAAKLLVYVSGLGLIAAGVSIIIKVYTRLATLLLALLLLLIILTLHVPGAASGDQTAMSMLLKDFGLLGASLYLSGHFKK